MDCSLPGSSVHGIFQARVLEWVAIAFSCNCSDTPIRLTAMGGKHHLMRHEDKAQTRLRGHTLWTTARLWPEQMGRQGKEDGWVNYSLGGGGSGLTMTKQTTGWDRKSKPMMKHTVRELQQQGKHTELFFYKYLERNQAWNHREIVKGF